MTTATLSAPGALSNEFTITDLFCGAGGSSSGAAAVPGVKIRMAANHWKLAVETHNSNHPDADHDCADISQVDPRRFPRTRILWASPSCTNHSQAKGRKQNIDATPDLFGEFVPDEAADRSRATMWDVPRFAEYHRYDAVIVENVVEAAKWIMWPAWLQAMQLLGYDFEVVMLNSMHAQALGDPAPQSRDRLYVIFWRKGARRPNLTKWTRPQAWCPSCCQVVRAVQDYKNGVRWGRYRSQYLYKCPTPACRGAVVEPGYLPASVAIDWTLPGQRIGDRDKPLAPKTRARIAAGLERYARPRLLIPLEGRDGKEPRSVDEPLRTQTTRNQDALVCAPFIAELRGGGSTSSPVSDTLATVTASGNHHALCVPQPADVEAMVMRNNTGLGEMCTPTAEELRTLTTAGHQSLVTWNALYGYDTGALRSPAEVLPAQTTVQGDALLTGTGLPEVDDCLLRMLEPHEIQAGMAFASDYLVLGNKREKVRMLGNAVTPNAARDLVAAVVEALSGEELARLN